MKWTDDEQRIIQFSASEKHSADVLDEMRFKFKHESTKLSTEHKELYKEKVKSFCNEAKNRLKSIFDYWHDRLAEMFLWAQETEKHSRPDVCLNILGGMRSNRMFVLRALEFQLQLIYMRLRIIDYTDALEGLKSIALNPVVRHDVYKLEDLSHEQYRSGFVENLFGTFESRLNAALTLLEVDLPHGGASLWIVCSAKVRQNPMVSNDGNSILIQNMVDAWYNDMFDCVLDTINERYKTVLYIVPFA